MTEVKAEQFEQKMAILNMAIEVYGMSLATSASAPSNDPFTDIINAATRLETFVKGSETTLTTGELQRKAFLDSLPQTGCGRGLEACNGSEGTCTCQ